MRIAHMICAAVMTLPLLMPAKAAIAAPTMTFYFSKYDESQWVPVREDRFPSPGTFYQQDGCITNAAPGEDVNKTKGGGYVMRLLKGVDAKDGRAELELSLIGGAAPSIVFHTQMQDAELHGQLYSLVIYNTSEKDGRQGVNLWKWVGSPTAGGTGKWQKIAYWRLPVPREQKIKLGVEFKGDQIRVLIDGKEIGGMRDAAPIGPAGGVGIVAMEGQSKFYSFSFTPLN